jgi:hypothetical protein
VKTKDKIELEFDNSCGEQWEWEDKLYDLEENFLKPINPDLCFYITGRNMGWQNRDGWLCKKFKDAQDFCFGVFPDTSWTAKFTLEDGRLYIRLSHHDSPMGEQYEVKKAGTCAVCGEPEKDLVKDRDGWDVCEHCRDTY